MQKRWWLSLALLALLICVGIGLAAAAQTIPANVFTGQEVHLPILQNAPDAAPENQVAQDAVAQAQISTAESPLPTPSLAGLPTQEVVVITPLPDGSIVFPTLVPGEQYLLLPHPTSTPWPTVAPWPTPTPKLGVVEKAWPLPRPADDAAGNLVYRTQLQSDGPSRYILVAVGAAGDKQQEPQLRWTEVDPGLFFVGQSPTGRYSLFLQVVMPASAIPYVLDQESGVVRPLFAHPELYKEYVIDNFDDIAGHFHGWHPDGKRILFWAATTPYPGLWLVDVETGERTIIRLADNQPQGASISPDGLRIAYAANEGRTQLEIANTDGSAIEVVSEDTAIALDGWSPDGKYLLYRGGPIPAVEADVTDGEGPFWIFDVAGRESHPLHIPYLTGYPVDAVWSPDSKYVAVVGAEEARIYLEEIQSGEAKLVAEGVELSWSPDGKHLAFLALQAGIPEVWIYTVDDGGLAQVTSDGLWKWNLTWEKEWSR